MEAGCVSVGDGRFCRNLGVISVFGERRILLFGIHGVPQPDRRVRRMRGSTRNRWKGYPEDNEHNIAGERQQ